MRHLKSMRQIQQGQNFTEKNKYFKVVDGQKSIENVVLSVKNIIFNEL